MPEPKWKYLADRGYDVGMHLIACKDCDRQYDVSRHEEGSIIRCVCGQTVAVQHLPAHEPKIRRCSGCGAPLNAATDDCRYCRVKFDPKELSFTSVCPHCHARMTDDAKFCMECGKEIAPQYLVAIAANQSCPRCQSALISRRIETTSLVECSACMGIWIPAESFQETCKSAEKQVALGQGLLARSAEKAGASIVNSAADFKYLPCLDCGDLMVPRHFGGNSGIIIDVCGRHGVWLDEGEMAAILEYIKSGRERLDDAWDGSLKRKPIRVDHKSLEELGRDPGPATDSHMLAPFLEGVLHLLSLFFRP